jgi:uncharacterized protein YsxB (DUF464 family)
MTTAEFFKKNGCITGFRVVGHSGYSENGSDVVCASVSSAVMLTANLITDFLGFAADVSAKGDVFTLNAVSPDEKQLQSIFEGLVTHLEMIREEYGKKYLKIKLTEV